MVGKCFFNLFCYIVMVIVYVVRGGVCSIISVDLLKIYLDWVCCNLLFNGFFDK